MPSIGKWFSDGGDLEDVIYGLFREFEPQAVLTRDIIFDCPCNEQTFLEHVRHLPKQELDDIIKNDPSPIEIICHSCGSKYLIPKEKLGISS